MTKTTFFAPRSGQLFANCIEGWRMKGWEQSTFELIVLIAELLPIYSL